MRMIQTIYTIHFHSQAKPMLAKAHGQSKGGNKKQILLALVLKIACLQIPRHAGESHDHTV